jgi:hypothetical protein
MKKNTTVRNRILAGILVVLLLPVGCGPTPHEEAMDKMVDCFREMTEILSTIRDEATAEVASLKLEAVKTKMKELEATMKNMEPPTPEEQRSLQKKFESEMQTVLMDFGNEMMRIMAIPGLGEEMGEALADLTPS